MLLLAVWAAGGRPSRWIPFGDGSWALQATGGSHHSSPCKPLASCSKPRSSNWFLFCPIAAWLGCPESAQEEPGCLLGSGSTKAQCATEWVWGWSQSLSSWTLQSGKGHKTRMAPRREWLKITRRGPAGTQPSRLCRPFSPDLELEANLPLGWISSTAGSSLVGPEIMCLYLFIDKAGDVLTRWSWLFPRVVWLFVSQSPLSPLPSTTSLCLCLA